MGVECFCVWFGYEICRVRRLEERCSKSFFVPWGPLKREKGKKVSGKFRHQMVSFPFRKGSCFEYRCQITQGSNGQVSVTITCCEGIQRIIYTCGIRSSARRNVWNTICRMFINLIFCRWSLQHARLSISPISIIPISPEVANGSYTLPGLCLGRYT